MKKNELCGWMLWLLRGLGDMGDSYDVDGPRETLGGVIQERCTVSRCWLICGSAMDWLHIGHWTMVWLSGTRVPSLATLRARFWESSSNKSSTTSVDAFRLLLIEFEVLSSPPTSMGRLEVSPST
jgi:hypothetical protein